MQDFLTFTSKAGLRARPVFRLNCVWGAVACLLAGSALWPLSAAAAEQKAAEGEKAAQATQAAADGDASLTLGEINVSGSAGAEGAGAGGGALTARQVFTSVDILGASLFRDERVDQGWELFSKAPGVQLTHFRQGTEAGRISFRGFNGEGRINAVKMLIDGIPANDARGGMPFIDAVYPLEIEAIEVVRGTNDARYGLHNIAGNANIITRTGGNYGDASLTFGSFATKELQVAKGIETGAWSQNYFAAWRDSDGYRDHSRARKYALSGKWFYTPAGGVWRAGVSARIYNNDAEASGYLSREQARRTPRLSPAFAANDDNERDVSQLALHLDGQAAPELAWAARAWLNRYEDRRFVRYSATGLQQERYHNEKHHGAAATLTWSPQVSWAHQFTLEGGLDWHREDNQSHRWRTVQQVRTTQFRNWDFDLNNTGGYVQAVWRPVPALKIVPALRLDKISGRFRDASAGSSAPMHDWGLIRQPKISLAYTLGERATAYANWGRSFQIGSERDGYRTSRNNLKPSINDGWEVGLKLTHGVLQGRLAYWEQRASGEVARVLGVYGGASSTEPDNVGATLRRGFDVQIHLKPRADLNAWLSYSRQKATITTPDPAAPETRGRQIENVPRYLVSAGLDWQATPQFKLGLSASAEGDYFLDRTNTHGKAGKFALLNLSAQYRFTPALDVVLQVKNLTNRNYYYGWYDSGASGFAPGDGRAFYATLNYHF